MLSKRIEFIKEKLEGDQKQSGEYFSGKGIRLSVSNIQAFAVCVEKVFVNTEYLGRIVGWLSNHDIRRGLQIAQRIITSPIISIEKLVSIFITEKRTAIHERRVRQAIIQGNYNGFVQKDSDFVLNVFAVSPTAISTPFAKLSILRVLMDRDVQANSPEESYMTIDDIVNYCEPIGMDQTAVVDHCGELLDYRLAEPYDPTDLQIYMDQRVKVTHAGRIHMEFALEDETYVVQMALATPIRNADIAARGREIFYGGRKMNRIDWLEILGEFANYCHNEDEIFVTVPNVPSYAGQRELRERFVRRWCRSGGGMQPLALSN